MQRNEAIQSRVYTNGLKTELNACLVNDCWCFNITYSLFSSIQMSIFGLQDIYPTLLALSTLIMIISGIPMSPLRRLYNSIMNKLFNNDSSINTFSPVNRVTTTATNPSILSQFLPSPTFRSYHRFFSILILIPLTITVITGSLYSIGRWLGLGKVDLKIYMYFHEGRYVGEPAVYTTLLGITTLSLVITGIRLTPFLRNFLEHSHNEQQRQNTIKYQMINVHKAFDPAAPSDIEETDVENEHHIHNENSD